jgi:hypothetical protein
VSGPGPDVDLGTALEFLSRPGPRNMYLFVNRPDGTVGGWPMLSNFRDGQLEFTTYRKSAKTRAVFADPRLCMVVLPPAGDDDPRALAVWGVATESDDPLAFLQTNQQGTVPISVPGEIRTNVAARLEGGKRVVFRVAVHRAAFCDRPGRSSSPTQEANDAPS